MRRLHGAVLVSGALLSLGACGADASDAAAARETRAHELFAVHCSTCHGPRGLGDGPAAAFLHPPARDFSLGTFRLVSAPGGPSVDDLVATLRRGMPGSAMPGFAWLGDEDLALLAEHVRGLATDGLVRRASVDEREFDEVAALETVARRLTPGTPPPPFELGPIDAALRARGADLFRSYCAACHGQDGRGRGLSFARNEDGSMALARDFTAGILKGGAAPDALAKRITCGLPGSSMPGFALPAEDVRALVAHVSGLIPPDAESRFRQVRRELSAARCTGEPGDADWAQALATKLHTAPLAWHDGAVLELEVAALHDGERLWVRLTWADASRDDETRDGALFADAVAVQLSDVDEPPLFAMGAEDTPVELWHWSAARPDEVAGARDPWEVHRALGHSDVTPAIPEGGGAGARTLAGRGVGRAEGSTELESEADWAAGSWTVVLSRPLAGGATPLGPGAEVRVAFAVWNGAAEEAGGRKSITIWQRLRLAD